MSASFQSTCKRIVATFLILAFYLNAYAQVETLLPEMDYAGGLKSNSVRCIMIDIQGRVWTGTDHGLDILNTNTTAQKNIIQTIGNLSIWGINFLDSLVFVGSRFDGLFVFNQLTGRLVKRYTKSVINNIWKIKVFDNEVFILSDEGAYKWTPKGLFQLDFTKNTKHDFPTDMFKWRGGLYATVYGQPTARGIIKFTKNSFEKLSNQEFIPSSETRNIICAKSEGNKLVLGGDGFYIIKEGDEEPKLFLLPHNTVVNYVVYDIAIIGSKVFLALGENFSNQKGLLYIHGNTFIDNLDEDGNGFLRALAWDKVNDCLYYGDLNKGLFLQKSISGISDIAKTKHAVILANAKKYVLVDDLFIRNLIQSNSKHSTNSDLIVDAKRKNIASARLFGDTLVIVTYQGEIRIYNATSFKLLRTYPKIAGAALMSLELIGKKLSIFPNYGGAVQYDLSCNKKPKILNFYSFLPITHRINDRVIILNKEKGFNFIEKDTVYSLSSNDKAIAFSDDFAIIKDTLHVLAKNMLKSFKIDYASHTLVPINNFDVTNTIEGFIAKWIISNNDKLYLLNDKGILQFQPANLLPINYYYLGNYNLIDRPVIMGDTLLTATTSLLTKTSFINIDKGSVQTNSGNINMLYPESVNENLGFSIDISHPDYLIQNHSLKFIELKKSGKVVRKKYTINNQFHLSNGLKYGDYNIECFLGNSKINKQISITLPLSRNPYFFGTILFFVLISFFLILKSRIDKRELNKKLLQNRLQILKQNLNPHFVFNSMNLISSLILEEKYEDAVQVVADFSSLQRTYLETNNKEAITLEEELSFLNAYLKLQQKRFRYDNNFSYNIDIANGIDTRLIILPPLILQPLAENAIKYGIIGSNASEKKISIDVNGADPVIIGIEDNGEEVGNSNKGFGLGNQLVLERINLFMNIRKTTIKVYFDKPALNSRFGYRVEIHIFR